MVLKSNVKNEFFFFCTCNNYHNNSNWSAFLLHDWEKNDHIKSGQVDLEVEKLLLDIEELRSSKPIIYFLTPCEMVSV